MRFLANIDALNMVESVGNLTKHRRASIVVKKGDEYMVTYVPAISGESVAHAYQSALVEMAKIFYPKDKLPVDEWSLRGEFFKYGDREHMPDELKEILNEIEKRKKISTSEILELKHNFEKVAISKSLIADIGGFMVAEERLPIKRTSLFQTGYVIPTFDTLTATAIDSQFHVRHIMSETIKRGEEEKVEERAAQAIYYVETASALYGLTFVLNLDGIGFTSMIKREVAVPEDERKKRIKVALGALSQLITGNGFGAKRSRFTPISEITSITVAVSKPKPFIVSPPGRKEFIEETLHRRNSFQEMMEKLGISSKVDLFAYSSEVKIPDNVNPASNVEDLFKMVIEKLGL